MGKRVNKIPNRQHIIITEKTLYAESCAIEANKKLRGKQDKIFTERRRKYEHEQELKRIEEEE